MTDMYEATEFDAIRLLRKYGYIYAFSHASKQWVNLKDAMTQTKDRIVKVSFLETMPDAVTVSYKRKTQWVVVKQQGYDFITGHNFLP